MPGTELASLRGYREDCSVSSPGSLVTWLTDWGSVRTAAPPHLIPSLWLSAWVGLLVWCGAVRMPSAPNFHCWLSGVQVGTPPCLIPLLRAKWGAVRLMGCMPYLPSVTSGMTPGTTTYHFAWSPASSPTATQLAVAS